MKVTVVFQENETRINLLPETVSERAIADLIGDMKAAKIKIDSEGWGQNRIVKRVSIILAPAAEAQSEERI